MPSGFDTTKQKDSGDSQNVIRSRLRGTKSLSDLSAMAAVSARIDREERLLGSIREIYAKYWRQEGVGPHPDNITANPALLKVLSMPDWQNKLQERGIEVNESCLQLISQRLKRIDPHDLLDYNRAVRNFNKTLDKFKREYFVVLPVKTMGLKGGIFYGYDEDAQEYYGRIITLRDPEGIVHVFNRGESDEDIARFTSRRISDCRNQFANQSFQVLEGHGYHPAPQQLEYYKNIYNRGEALTESQVVRLREDDNVHGWECTRLTYPTLPEEVYYTDMGNEVRALVFPRYQPYNREEHNRRYPPSRYRTIGDPTPIFNCHGHFIDRTAWLVPEKCGEYTESQIRKILQDNGYYSISPTHARINDIVAYWRDRSISHTSLVVQVDGKIIVESKLGELGLMQHDMGDSLGYGQPTIYRTERQGGHLLRTTRP